MTQYRLKQVLGPLTPWVLKPQRSALLCAFGWLSTLPLSWQYPLLSFLGFTALWGLTISIWLESPLFQVTLLPPLTVFLIGLALRWGLGPLLLAFSGSGDDSLLEIWIRYGPNSQTLWLCLTAALIFFALPQRRTIYSSFCFHSQTTWLLEARAHPRLKAQLRALAGCLSLYMISYILLSLFSGAFNRQFDSYAEWTNQLWRLDTPVAAFSRLRDLWFLLFPIWWCLLGRFWRLLLSVQILSFFCIALLSGSRGLLFYPALLLFFGLWFVLSDPTALRRLALVLAVAFLILSPLIYVVRDSPSFQDSKTFVGRIHSVGLALSQPEPLIARARWLGRDLYACHDPFLFTPENRDQPLVGFQGLSRLHYLWIPKHLKPDRPIIFDGHLIAKQLQRIVPSAWSEVWFPCFSLPADLMRRWSFPGVFVGSVIVGALLHIAFSYWYRSATIFGSTYQLLLFLFPSTYLQAFPFGTVSETAWSLFWELPKYIVFFWLFGFVVDRHLKRSLA